MARSQKAKKVELISFEQLRGATAQVLEEAGRNADSIRDAKAFADLTEALEPIWRAIDANDPATAELSRIVGFAYGYARGSTPAE